MRIGIKCMLSSISLPYIGRGKAVIIFNRPDRSAEVRTGAAARSLTTEPCADARCICLSHRDSETMDAKSFTRSTTNWCRSFDVGCGSTDRANARPCCSRIMNAEGYSLPRPTAVPEDKRCVELVRKATVAETGPMSETLGGA